MSYCSDYNSRESRRRRRRHRRAASSWRRRRQWPDFLDRRRVNLTHTHRPTTRAPPMTRAQPRAASACIVVEDWSGAIRLFGCLSCFSSRSAAARKHATRSETISDGIRYVCLFDGSRACWSRGIAERERERGLGDEKRRHERWWCGGCGGRRRPRSWPPLACRQHLWRQTHTNNRDRLKETRMLLCDRYVGVGVGGNAAKEKTPTLLAMD